MKKRTLLFLYTVALTAVIALAALTIKRTSQAVDQDKRTTALEVFSGKIRVYTLEHEGKKYAVAVWDQGGIAISAIQ